MSRKNREDWQALLDADPALKAAWDGFQSVLGLVSRGLTTPGDRSAEEAEHDLIQLRLAALRVRAEAGEDATHH